MNGFTAHQPPKAGLVFLNLAIGLPCEIFLQISQGEFVFWCLLFGISPVFFHLSDTANPHSAAFDPKGALFLPFPFILLTLAFFSTFRMLLNPHSAAFDPKGAL